MSLVKLARSNTFKRTFYVIRHGLRNYSENLEDNNKPVKYSTSEAAGWKAEYSRSGNIYDDSPDAQPFILSISTAIFLFYFLYYREESDIDDRFDIGANIYSKVEGLEEVNLRVLRQGKLNKGESVVEIDKRLKEVESERLKNVSQT